MGLFLGIMIIILVNVVVAGKESESTARTGTPSTDHAFQRNCGDIEKGVFGLANKPVNLDMTDFFCSACSLWTFVSFLSFGIDFEDHSCTGLRYPTTSQICSKCFLLNVRT